MDLFLRKVIHSHARDNFRVIFHHDDEELEVGSIGVQNFTAGETRWAWGIDCVIPMHRLEIEGDGASRHDCMRKFKAAWLTFAGDEAQLIEFLNAKRAARRRSPC